MSSGEQHYRIRDASGLLRAVHVREDRADGTKAVRWQRPDGTPGLNGTPLHDLPLYGAHELGDYDPDELVALVEGEKARDALAEAGVPALGTVTGAGHTPSEAALAPLRGRRVALWPDHDEQGRKHMHNVAQRLQGLASELLWYEWPEAMEKGDDAADHPAVQNGDRKALGKLRTDLEGAPRWSPPKPPNRLLESRVLLGDGMMHGIDPPEELEPGVLLRGKVHSLYAPPGAGKTMLMLWLVKRCVERGDKVLLLDSENGHRIISERLEDMGADPARIDDHLVYLSSPGLAMPDQPDYLALLDEVQPALVVFDSLISFLASAGCEENSATDIASWAGTFCHPARDRGVAVLLLDHVPHDGAHARGSTRKKDEVDVQWSLRCTQPFDRDSVGEIVIFREKDREAWLPPSVKFSVGGAQAGFLFERSEGTVEEPGDSTGGLNANEQKVLAMLQEKGHEGASWGDLKRGFDRSIGTLSNTLRSLRRLNRCRQTENPKRYYAVIEQVKPISKPDQDCSTVFKDRSIEQLNTDESETVQSVHTPYGGEQLNTDVEHSSQQGSGTASVDQLFAAPPDWLAGQVARYREDPERHIKPLCAAVARHLGLDAGEVRPEVERALAGPEEAEDPDGLGVEFEDAHGNVIERG